MGSSLLLFYFYFYFFKWRQKMFTFFLLFTWKSVLFVLLFEIPKKIEVQNFLCILQASYSHTRAIIGIFSKFRFFEKSRYFRQKPFLKKSKLLKIALGRCFLFFVYPEGQNRKAPNLHFTAQAAEWMPSISEKSSIWEKFGF